jgi:hypothetical protein
MLPPPNEMISSILAGSLLPSLMFENLDCDPILDARDRDTPFEREWLLTQEDLKSRWQATTPDPRDLATLEDLRREAFLVVFTTTKHDDLAASVSEDFGLIGMAAFLRQENPLAERLWASYRAGRIPQP